jgi:hypothetical protein
VEARRQAARHGLGLGARGDARIYGNLQDWMPKPAPKHTRVEHMRAPHYNKIPDFMARLRETQTGVGARALPDTVIPPAPTGMSFSKMDCGPGFGAFLPRA